MSEAEVDDYVANNGYGSAAEITALTLKENSDSTALGALIDDNTSNIATNTTDIATNLATIGTIQTKMVVDSTALGSLIDAK